MYDSRLLTEELLGLEKNSATGRVDHSPLGINSKDTADAVCGAVWNASRNAEEFEYDFGETLDTVMTANADNGVSAQAQQLSIDFENEMRKMLDTTPTKISDPGKPAPELTKTTFTPSVIDSIILW